MQADHDLDCSCLDKIYYNPYITSYFTNTANLGLVRQSRTAYFIDRVCFIEKTG